MTRQNANIYCAFKFILDFAVLCLNSSSSGVQWSAIDFYWALKIFNMQFILAYSELKKRVCKYRVLIFRLSVGLGYILLELVEFYYAPFICSWQYAIRYLFGA